MTQQHADIPAEWGRTVRELTKVNKKALGEQKGAALRALRELAGAKAAVSSPDIILASWDEGLRDWILASEPYIAKILGIGAGHAISSARFSTMFNLENPRAVSWMGQWGATRITKVDAETKRVVREYLSGAISEGQGVAEMEKGLGELFDGWIRGAPYKQSRAEKIARTETGFAYNSGSLLGYQANGVRHVKVMDDEGPNSCDACREANGQIWDIEFAINNPLQHPSCVRAFAAVVEGI